MLRQPRCLRHCRREDRMAGRKRDGHGLPDAAQRGIHRLPLATLFRSPTIEQLARILRQDEPATPWSALVPIQPRGSKPPLFFMHSGGGHVLEYYPLASNLEPDQPFYALQSALLNGYRIDIAPSIEDLAARYIREIRG